MLRFIAADLLAQAEHDPDAIALLVTTSRRLAEQVARGGGRATGGFAGDKSGEALAGRKSAILLAPDPGAAVRFANRFAPEHLSVPTWGRGSEAGGKTGRGGQRVSRTVERAIGWGLRQRHQPCSAHQRRRAYAGRAFHLGFRALHHRAAGFAGRPAQPRAGGGGAGRRRGLVAHRRAVEVRR